jgi:hypothetical protein
MTDTRNDFPPIFVEKAVFAYDIKEYIKKTHSFQQNIESF